MRAVMTGTALAFATACGGGMHPATGEGASGRSPALVSLVEAERAFAKLAGDSGSRVAFLANMSDSSIIFRPTAVRGRTWFLATPPDRPKALLAWEPRWAGVSRAGDLGFTTGPYNVRPGGASDTVVRLGTYVTVWGRGSSSDWKLLVDFGSPGPSLWPLSESRRGDWTSPLDVAAPPAADPAALRRELLQLDSALGETQQDPAAPPRFLARFDEDSRVHRAGRKPVIGVESSRRALAERPGRWSSSPGGGGVARSGDLGYTYGMYELRTVRGSTAERGNYLRIWRRSRAGEWRITLDLAVGQPPPA